MSFQFVENNAIDGFSRKQIRSHVMRGKNKGKRCARVPKETKEIALRPILRKDVEASSGSSGPVTHADNVSIPMSLGDALSYFTFPCELSSHTKFLIERFMWAQMYSIYPVEFCISMDPIRSSWFRFLLTSEAFFHNTLAVAQQCADTLEGRDKDSYQALVYLARTYRCMNREFEKNTTPSDSTIAVVASLLFHENIVWQYGSPKTHLDALERIIAMRGGLESLAIDSKLLLQKICRGDIDFAIHKGCSPRFFRDQFPYKTITASQKDNPDPDKLSIQLLRVMSNVTPQLRRIHEDLMSFCAFLNNLSTPPRLDPSDFEEALISLAYRLLYLRPVNGKAPENIAENAYQLGALTLVWTVMFEAGRLHRSPYTLLADNIQNAVALLATSETTANPLLMWLLFVGGISVIGSNEKGWIYCQIRDCASTLHIDDWHRARKMLKMFPWVDLIHDKPAQRVWEAAFAWLHQEQRTTRHASK